MADCRHKGADRDEFRLGLEELVRGHVGGCMAAAAALASCSSASVDEEGDPGGAAGSGDGAEQLVRRRRRSDLEGEDLAETSAAARRHSRILSRWVARQAEEMMITTMERRNRETELLALARLHTVSTLDASFLRETRRATAQPTVERPAATARASAVLQRWREIEDESAASARNRSSPIAQTPATANHDRESRGQALQPDSSEVSSESNDGEDPQCPDGSLSSTSGREDTQDLRVENIDGRGSSREQSPDFEENVDGERERVRQIVRGWMAEAPLADTALRISPTGDSLRDEWLGERERERVRLVREWVQSASQQGDAPASRRDEQERDGLVTDHEDVPPEHVRRDFLRLRGRQARIDLIMRMARERERELQNLSEHRAVSCFPHCNRIQSFLRGRFLRTGGPSEDERRPSVAAGELGQLRQRHPVSILREGFPFRQDLTVAHQAISQSGSVVNSDINDFRHNTHQSTQLETSSDNTEQPQVANVNNEVHQEMETYSTFQTESRTEDNNIEWNNSADHQRQAEELEHRESNLQQSTNIRLSGWHDGIGEEYTGSWQENVVQDWPREAPEDEDSQRNRSLEEHENWHEDESQGAEVNWEDISSDQQSLHVRRVNRFMPPDDDSVYSMELRELLSRRSVSNLLHSGFRESLDQLIQSYVERQGRDPFDWDLERTMQNPDLSEDQEQHGDDSIQEQQNSVTRPQQVPPSPPPAPPSLWHTEFHHSWRRQSIHHSEMEWEIINDLRADMARLQQVMSHMQRMLEACMEMQLELQRAVRQEVSAALNRSVEEQGEVEEASEDGVKWSHVRKGICCVCCNNHIDSLLYRCGHMCSCSRCANELVRERGKCPLCRAPIVEVIRAYSIL